MVKTKLKNFPKHKITAINYNNIIIFNLIYKYLGFVQKFAVYL